MATAFKEFYPDSTLTNLVGQHLMSDSILVGPRRQQRFVHDLSLPGDLMIETDGPELRDDVRAVVDAFLHVNGLEAGWDTYNARPVAAAVFRPALDLALYAVQRCHPPRITAVNDGGVTLAWECGDCELELGVGAVGAVNAFMVDQAGDEHEPEEPLSLSEAKGWIDTFCRP